MKGNDEARHQRELQGDFSEIDAYLRADRIKMVLCAAGLAACLFLFWLTT